MVLHEPGEPIRAARFSSDGRYLGWRRSVRSGTPKDSVSDLGHGARQRRPNDRDGVGDVAFDRTGARLVTFDGEVVETWNVGTGACVAEGQVDAEVVVSSVLSSDGSHRAALPDGTIRLFDACAPRKEGTPHGTPPPHRPSHSAPTTAAGHHRLRPRRRQHPHLGLDIDDLLDIARREVTRASPTRSAGSSCTSTDVLRREGYIFSLRCS